MKLHKTEITLDGQLLVFETGILAKQANGSVLIKSGDTVVLATACMKNTPEENPGFFPLIVSYQEKTYAAGRIPGGFFKREGRPKENEILTSRLIDRSIRPLFPNGMRNDVQVVCTVLSSDGNTDPSPLAVNAASCALTISDIPFQGPIACVTVGKIKEGFVLNPTYSQKQESSLDLLVSANKDKILMIEAKASQENEEVLLEAIKFAHEHIKAIIESQNGLQSSAGKQKTAINLFLPSREITERITTQYKEDIEKLNASKDGKHVQYRQIINSILEDLKDENLKESDVEYALEKAEKDIIRKKILEEKFRPDNRSPKDIRPVSCSVSVLPRTHGSAVFTRGQTQSLAITTLGTVSDQQMIEDLSGQSYKDFMLHYSFPPFSVGEVSPLRSPSRREIGHGALAEKSLETVMPDKERFPYTIRIVSEILESNGSSSMATVCASTLSLMDAGVPIEAPVAGVALGLVSDSQDNYLILTDIAGIEDHCGDMDFKIAGTQKGITAIQLDLKISGISYEIIKQSLDAAKEARLTILDKMAETLKEPKKELSEYAPRIITLKIDPSKIGELIGPGGKTIKKIVNTAGVSLDIDDEQPRVVISAPDNESLQKGLEMVESITKDLEIGKAYTALVSKITNFGAFCDIGPSKSGLLHISEISNDYVKNVSDYLKEGDLIKVKVISIDEQGRINLSKKQMDEKDNQ